MSQQATRRSFEIRCSGPECPWGFPTSSLGEMSTCYDEFRRHCIEAHGLDASDRNVRFQLDLETLFLSCPGK